MSTPYVGEIRLFAGNFAPVGWALCNGALMSIAENTVLFQLIGTTYGGDGQTTFALPDLRGRAPMHLGTGPGLSPRVIGQSGGAETVTLTVAQLPAHTHTAAADAHAATSPDPAGRAWAASNDYAQFGPVAGAPANLHAGAVGSSGGGQPHDNMLPFVTINFIISLFGVYPTQ
jgi:microcystin-dependent protein